MKIPRKFGRLAATAAIAAALGFSSMNAPSTAGHASGGTTASTSSSTATASSLTADDASPVHEATLMSYATVCKTIYVSHLWWASGGTLQAYLYVPICYNGMYVWIHGNISCHAPGIGWSTSINWCGWYNDPSGHWLGVGENIHAELGGFISSIDETPRWYINANGVNYAYSTY